jgi:hypothetical protein
MSGPVFAFDEATHRYTLDGRPLVSVTQALKGAGVVDFSGIPEATLENARRRGKAVHAACHYLDEGDLLESSVKPHILPYVKAWAKAKAELGLEVLKEFTEKPIYHPTLLYAGTPDRVCVYKGRVGVWDLKTYEADEWTGLQTAGYEAILRNGAVSIDRWAIWLRSDESYRLRQFSEARDWPTFQACLTVTSWKLLNGGKIS